MNKYDICGFDKEQELNNLHNKNDLEKEVKEICLKADLDKALNYFVESATIEELKIHFNWYKVNNIHDLKTTMFESYLNTMDNIELEERIQALYGEEL